MRGLLRCSFAVLGGFVLSISIARAEPSTRRFKVGLILPFTGHAAEYGIAVRNSVELARAKHPERFQNVNFLFEDSLYDGKASISIFNKMRSIDHADLILVWGHGPVEAVAPIAEAARTPMIAVSGSQTVAKGKNFVVRYCTPHQRFANALLSHVRKNKFKKLAVVKTELGFINDTVAELQKGIGEGEGLELIDNFAPGENAFQNSVTKLKAKSFDLLGLFLAEDQVAPFLAKMHGIGMKAPLFGTHSLGGKASIASVREHADGGFFAANSVSESFAISYAESYGNDIQIAWAANGYDFAMLTAKLFGRLESPPTEQAIVNAFKAVRGEEGVTGRYDFVEDERGSGFVFPLVIKIITKDGIRIETP